MSLNVGSPGLPGDAVDTAPQWIRLLAGLVAVFALFHGSAQVLGSDRGQAGIAVGLLVVAATLAVERLLFGRGLGPAARALGLGRPATRGVVAAGAICLALLLVVPAYARVSGAPMSFLPGGGWLLPGLFVQGGIAEEVLFRGYLFGRLLVPRLPRSQTMRPKAGSRRQL